MSMATIVKRGRPARKGSWRVLLGVTILGAALALLPLMPAYMTTVSGTQAGDAGDLDPTTFTFKNDSSTVQMTKLNETAIDTSEVGTIYSKPDGMTIFVDGVDVASDAYAGPGGKKTAVGADLNSPGWQNAYVEPGQVAIDPVSGRFKFNTNAPRETYQMYMGASIQVNGVAVAGGYAYLAAGTAGLYIVNVSNPSSPSVVGSVTMPGNRSAQKVAIADHYAYVAVDGLGLKVFDVKDPAAPAAILNGEWQRTSGGSTTGVQVVGQYAYVIGASPSLQILDVKEPWNMKTKGSYTVSDPGAVATGIHVQGNFAYIALGATGLKVLDISDPNNPHEYGNGWDSPSLVMSVFVSGNYAFLADYEMGLQILDVSDPWTPTWVGGLRTWALAYDVVVAGKYAYLADHWKGLETIDVSDPSHPYQLANTPGLNAINLTVEGNFAYVAAEGWGFRIFQLAAPLSNMPVVGTRTLSQPANKARVVGSYAYVADGTSGLQVLSVLDPANIAQVGSAPIPQSANDVAIEGGFAYVAYGSDDTNSGIAVVNVANPSAPSVVSTTPISGTARGIFVSRHLAFVAAGSAGLKVYDVSNPAAPTHIATSTEAKDAWSVYVAGVYAYVADGANGLRVFRFDDPWAPILAGTAPTNFALAVHVSGNYAYVADHSDSDWQYPGRLEIIDVTTPASPSHVGLGRLPGIAYDVFVAGPYAYVAGHWQGVSVLDVSNPAAPLKKFTISAGTVTGIWSAGKYLYAATTEGPEGARYGTVRALELPSEAPTGQVTVNYNYDHTPPTTSMAPLPSEQNITSFQVSWSGSDGGLGIKSYDIQYKVESSGTWTDWMTNTTATSAWFGPTSPATVQAGKTYYFRVHARDNADNVSPYRSGDGDTYTHISASPTPGPTATPSPSVTPGPTFTPAAKIYLPAIQMNATH